MFIEMAHKHCNYIVIVDSFTNKNNDEKDMQGLLRRTTNTAIALMKNGEHGVLFEKVADIPVHQGVC